MCAQKAIEFVVMQFPVQRLDVLEMKGVLMMAKASIEPPSKVKLQLLPNQMLVDVHG